jgi:hypothetical protein
MRNISFIYSLRVSSVLLSECGKNVYHKKNNMSTDRENGRGNKRARAKDGYTCLNVETILEICNISVFPFIQKLITRRAT